MALGIHGLQAWQGRQTWQEGLEPKPGQKASRLRGQSSCCFVDMSGAHMAIIQTCPIVFIPVSPFFSCSKIYIHCFWRASRRFPGRLCRVVIDGHLENCRFCSAEQGPGWSPQCFLRSEIDEPCHSSICTYQTLSADRFCGIIAL